MIDPVVSPVFLLRSYIWQVIKANTTLNETDYDGLVPIVPVAEEPRLSEFSQPYIVYGYAMNPTNDGHFHNSGSMTFAIYSENFREITRLFNIIVAAFEREDDSARDINVFTSLNPAFRGIRITTTAVNFAEGGAPEESEGGRQSALVNIRFSFVVEYNVKVSPVITTTVTGDELAGWS